MPRSQTMRARIALKSPSRVAPTSTSISSPGAGFDAAKSSMRVNATRTGRFSLSAAAAASGSGSISLPPNAPPSGVGRTRTRSSGTSSSSARPLRVANAPCVALLTTIVPSKSSQAVAACGSR